MNTDPANDEEYVAPSVQFAEGKALLERMNRCCRSRFVVEEIYSTPHTPQRRTDEGMYEVKAMNDGDGQEAYTYAGHFEKFDHACDVADVLNRISQAMPGATSLEVVEFALGRCRDREILVEALEGLISNDTIAEEISKLEAMDPDTQDDQHARFHLAVDAARKAIEAGERPLSMRALPTPEPALGQQRDSLSPS